MKTNEWKYTCPRCGGSKLDICNNCNGFGYNTIRALYSEESPDGEECPYCGGGGIVDCRKCGGTGMVDWIEKILGGR